MSPGYIFILSIVFKLFIMILPFRTLIKLTSNIKTDHKLIDQHVSNDQLIKLKNTILNYSKFMPWMNCMVSAFSVQHILKLNNISSEINLGIDKNTESMKAHAWLSCNRIIITGAEQAHKYSKMTTYVNDLS